ncbi:MAG: hypothetical protein GY796_15545 [Chloroflexi bacterium]|nr:hypothetical protein [Chloroflexota bacterium]
MITDLRNRSAFDNASVEGQIISAKQIAAAITLLFCLGLALIWPGGIGLSWLAICFLGAAAAYIGTGLWVYHCDGRPRWGMVVMGQVLGVLGVGLVVLISL